MEPNNDAAAGLTESAGLERPPGGKKRTNGADDGSASDL